MNSQGTPSGARAEASAAAPAHAPGTLPNAAPAAVPPFIRRARGVVLAATLGLVVLGLAWELWLAPTGRGTWAVKVLPLVLMLPGLARHRLASYRGLSLLLWLYVLEGLVRATSERGPMATTVVWLASLQVVLAVAAFVAATLYIRRRLASAPADATAPPMRPTS